MASAIHNLNINLKFLDEFFLQWTSALSEHLGHGDPSKLRIWQHNQYNQMPQKYAIKSK
jgi:hypothetical protein